ncbi:GNAT family N-acetyltransferase [Streptomyces clavuligerus]|nr:GNAT family N-acetyltransferase [Streptomyces clavuligerus]MBY6301456.1 GNAT family N-acetyltransferase [Streptomyces clavuligerus]QPL61744.1 GNAT family N-acetyltransferase [Streptomyces clavuligerus]QPL67777.1 GNAT family N-acetyltransferase [Streptomyces clavuligerus]QPL73853.1 GNAT family N-acetyltransferase [Streptomyces clavuligerus]
MRHSEAQRSEEKHGTEGKKGHHVKVVLHSERPELWDRIPEVFAGVVPEYNLHGDIGDTYWNRLFDDFGDHQFLLYDEEDDDILGAGRSLPRLWDGTPEGLGTGLDASIKDAFAAHDAGTPPTALCALGVEVAPAHQGKNLSKALLQQMIAMARADGLPHLIVPVRPIWKHRYPLVPVERYAHWCRADGEPFDPWIRAQVRLGGTVTAGMERSSLISGTVAEWESWTGMAYPESGDYVFPEGLNTLRVDRERDLATYWEPAVWITYDLRASAPAGPSRR